MKHLFASLFACCMLTASFGQNDDGIRPAAVGLSFFMNDFQTAQRIRSTSLSTVLSNKQWAKLREMSPGIAVSYFKGLRRHVDFAGTMGFSFIDYPMPDKPSFGTDYLLIEADASVNLKLVSEEYIVQPYVNVGIGASKYRFYYGAFMPVGLGLKVNILDEAALFVNSQYRVPVTQETSNYHFYHSIGLAGVVGKKKPAEPKQVEVPQQEPGDRDDDGITDDKDKCPDQPGVARYDGCPIPDRDGDGINDEEDKCPDVKGVARYDGCPIPDKDGDGINDEEDQCPDQPGVARYKGCPIPDKDGDGVNDEEDRCPDTPGPASNQGCPEITEEVSKKVDYAAQNILFVTGSFRLRSSSTRGLDEVAKIMNANVDLMLTIEGHTDNTGDAAKNQALSENRARAVKDYLVSKGIAESRLTAVGYGEDQPVADNGTAAGRAKNRRVELKLGY